MTKLTKKAEKARDARIERCYGRTCSGIQIPILKIPAIFRHAAGLIEANPAITDDELGAGIRALVDQIAVAA